MVEVLAEEEKQVIAAKGIFSDREVGVLGFDAYSRENTKHTIYAVFHFLGAIFRFLTYKKFIYFSK